MLYHTSNLIEKSRIINLPDIGTFDNKFTDNHYLQDEKVISSELASIVLENFDDTFHHKITQIRQMMMDGKDYCVLKNLPIDRMSPESFRLFVIGFSALFGEPTKTDKKIGKVAWKIKPDPKAFGTNLTFSQHNGEAELHTDTQYFDKPENIATLYCVNPDKNFDGANSLVNIRTIEKFMRSSDEGEKNWNVLMTSLFPFRVPTIFTNNRDDNEIEIIHKPIITKDIPIRYRKDTIQNAIKTGQVSITSEQSNALEEFNKVLNNPSFATSNFLNRGEALFVNNHTTLHARTSFEDYERFLYRVRINSK